MIVLLKEILDEFLPTKPPTKEIYESQLEFEFFINKLILEKELEICEDYVFINEDIYLVASSKTTTINSNIGCLEIDGEYKNSYYLDNVLYVCTSEGLYVVNLEIYSYSKVYVDLDINDLVVDEYIYLVGSFNNNPKIIVLSKELNILKEKFYQSNDEGRFTNIEIIKDSYLITLEKDAFFEHSDFMKVGNKNDKKSVLLMLSKSLDIEKTYYFNENNNVEVITSIEVMNSIKIILKANDINFLYEFIAFCNKI